MSEASPWSCEQKGAGMDMEAGTAAFAGVLGSQRLQLILLLCLEDADSHSQTSSISSWNTEQSFLIM